MKPEDVARCMDVYRRVVEYIGRSGPVVSDIDADEARGLKNNIVAYRVLVPQEIRDCVEIGSDLVKSLEEECNGIIAKSEISSL